jgi:hypothetical protein
MASADLMNNIHPVVALAPVVVTDGTLQTTAAIDTLGYESVTFIIALGTLADADATWEVILHEGDTSTQSAHTAAADIDIIGTEALAGFTFAADGACRKIGYRGSKRYVSLEIDDVVANSGNAPMCVIALLGRPRTAPTANPPA